MVNLGIHRGQAVSPGRDHQDHAGECSRAAGALGHLERAGWGPDSDPLLDAYADLTARARYARAYGTKGSVWSRVVYGAGTGAAKERLNNLWNTTSLVSALLMTFTYANIANPAKSEARLDPNSTRAIALEFANVAGILSFVMSLFCLMFNVVFHEIDYCTTSRDERDFVLGFAGVFDGVAGLFGGSVGMLLLSVLCTIYAIHPARTFYITVGACVALAAALFVNTVPITGYTRFRLWVRLEGAIEHRAGAGGVGGVGVGVGGSAGAKAAAAAAAAAAVSEGKLAEAGEVDDGQEGQERRAVLKPVNNGAVPVTVASSTGRVQAFSGGDVGGGGGGGGGLRGESALMAGH